MPQLAVSLIVAVLVPLAAAWLHARCGRKVRLKVGEIEAEAQTMDQIDELLDRAATIQRGREGGTLPPP